MYLPFNLDLAFAKVPTLKASRTLASLTCEAEVLNTLGSLEAPLEWIEVTPAGADLQIYRSETTTRNVRLEIGQSKDKVRLKRIDLRTEVHYDYDATQNCVPVLSVHALKESTSLKGKLFTDFEMQKVIDQSRAETKAHLIYMWSPRMSLSLRGLKEIAGLSKKHGLALTVVADPMADADELKQVVMKNRWPDAYTAKMDSFILRQKLATIHFPSLLIVKEGEFAMPVRPGYDAPERLEKLFGALEAGK